MNSTMKRTLGIVGSTLTLIFGAYAYGQIGKTGEDIAALDQKYPHADTCAENLKNNTTLCAPEHFAEIAKKKKEHSPLQSNLVGWALAATVGLMIGSRGLYAASGAKRGVDNLANRAAARMRGLR